MFTQHHKTNISGLSYKIKEVIMEIERFNNTTSSVQQKQLKIHIFKPQISPD